VSTVGQATDCFSCGVGAPTISKRLVYILSNNRCLQSHNSLANHPRWMS